MTVKEIVKALSSPWDGGSKNVAIGEAIRVLIHQEKQLADAEFAYKDIEEYEAILGHKVNDACKIGWQMARTTKKQLNALAGRT